MSNFEISDITKYYPETKTLANCEISLSIGHSEIHAVLGQNGAGKSTFAKIISGIVIPNKGSIFADGKKLKFATVSGAQKAGIALVPQTSLLATNLTVAENLIVGREPAYKKIFLSMSKARAIAQSIIEKLDLHFSPDTKVESLSPGARRQVEIARALALGSKLLVLDEPTSILSRQDSDALHALLIRLKEEGRSILYISHRISEIVNFADSITILKNGRVFARLSKNEADEDTLRSLLTSYSSPVSSTQVTHNTEGFSGDAHAIPISGAIMSAHNIVLVEKAHPVTLSVTKGEVLGILAFPGNGLEKLELVLAGIANAKPGKVLVENKALDSWNRRLLREQILGYVPARREKNGLSLKSQIRDNLLVFESRSYKMWDYFFRSKRDKAARSLLKSGGINAHPRQLAWQLSGGNRQKLVLAREVNQRYSLVLLANAYQGLDLLARDGLSSKIAMFSKKGGAVILLSHDFEDIVSCAHRIIVLYRGAIALELENKGRSVVPLLLAAMTGS